MSTRAAVAGLTFLPPVYDTQGLLLICYTSCFPQLALERFYKNLILMQQSEGVLIKIPFGILPPRDSFSIPTIYSLSFPFFSH